MTVCGRGFSDLDGVDDVLISRFVVFDFSFFSITQGFRIVARRFVTV
jgi:hypothetical protein